MSNFQKEVPYNSLPLLPPKAKLETTKILRKTITASRALAKLNGAITNLPNPTLFLDSIHLQEAKASSEIENIITTNDQLYKSVVADNKFENAQAKEVISYKRALWNGLKRLEEQPFITTNLCVEIMQEIKMNTSNIRTTPGTALSNNLGEIIYTPPSGESIIRKKLDNLERFINEDKSLDPLIKLALLHYQFEAIHPFSDGNGRTGRILLLLYLKIEKLLDIPAIFLSEYIILNKAEYYKKIREVTEEGNWENWIIYILDMIEWTSNQGIKRLDRILDSMEKTSLEIKTKLPKVFSRELVEILYKLPYTKRQNLINAKLGTAKTVGNYLIALEEQGILRSIKVGKEKLYLNHSLMKILENK
jgi:Fic family protein